MASGILSNYLDMLREGSSDLIPNWFKTVFLGMPTAKKLRFDGKRSDNSLPINILVNGELGDKPKQMVTVDAVLPTDLLLRRTIEIPPAARSSQTMVAKLDLQRRTPFKLSEIYWALDAEQTGTENQAIQWVAKRADITQFRTVLRSHGYAVRRFVTDGKTKQTTIADFTADIAPNARFWRRLNIALCILVIGFGVAIWLEPAWRARVETQTANSAVNALRAQAIDLRTEIEALKQADSERTAFLNAVSQHPRLVDALRQITVALPDTVWVSDLVFTGPQITVNGQTSASAADLVLQLTQSNLPYVPALTGPVSRTNDGREQFGLVFTSKRLQQ
ncbi:hypothetical protein DS901_02475 [Loktanella sp. D2R18]|uniref:PilN domain-containing protein n=1 Tax=Rhodobacterales TaxID=204455 RepID=UPI000DEAE33A|nr:MULTISPECIES: PilN domain-containing protein [Rhodobacterales]MDO6591945.1 PilN domain-containing protein [Yoonia sp. 1_MG-2023]RBW45648.1 hypothetical protein DS901_02475 [Loktanella sp. D2R18]